VPFGAVATPSWHHVNVPARRGNGSPPVLIGAVAVVTVFSAVSAAVRWGWAAAVAMLMIGAVLGAGLRLVVQRRTAE